LRVVSKAIATLGCLQAHSLGLLRMAMAALLFIKALQGLAHFVAQAGFLLQCLWQSAKLLGTLRPSLEQLGFLLGQLLIPPLQEPLQILPITGLARGTERWELGAIHRLQGKAHQIQFHRQTHGVLEKAAQTLAIGVPKAPKRIVIRAVIAAEPDKTQVL